MPKIGIGLAFAGILAVFPGFLGLLIVVGDRFIPWWMAGGILLTAALLVKTVQAAARRSFPDEEEFGWSELQSRWLRGSASLAAVFCLFGSGLDAFNGTRYVVVTENSAGCKLVARESTFLRAGSGTMFMAEPFGLAFRYSSWKVNEPGRPAREGDVEARWRGTTVTYAVWGSYGSEEEFFQSARCWTEAVLDRADGN
ncbi:hypothetical protein [Arthrobacter sp. IK3]|uniref:hypothetical protein n=1 Tax=Arthrobacter sp. IK3 TaxID=3448169 RepID=UPI003EE27EFB